ncbi:Cullin-domain-containing protein [Serendipita vermifera]|nr:Cullin-domain-containing protein [Serendipita vermifera]
MASTQPLRKGKGKIKPPKRHGPDTTTSDNWTNLAESIKEIQNERAYQLSFEENYRYAYNLVLYRQGEFLYKNVKNLITQHLTQLTEELIVPAFATGNLADPITRGQEGELLMKGVRKVWDKHNSSMRKLSDILKYMDRVYTVSAEVPEILQAGLKLFLDNVLHSQTIPVPQQVVDAILGQVQVEREGYTINQTAVKECVEIYLYLDDNSGKKVYYADIEPPFLAETRKFYVQEAQRLLETCDAAEYLSRVEQRLDSEETRAHYYLSPSTWSAVRTIVEANLLSPHLQTIVAMPGSGLDVMVDGNRLEDLNRMYRLFFNVSTSTGGPQALQKGLKESIMARGKVINESNDRPVDTPEDPKEGKGKGNASAQTQNLTVALKWVQDALDLKDKFDTILKRALMSDRACELAITEAIGSSINQNPRAPEYISLFIDENLKRGLKGKSDDEVDIVLDKTITLFRFITEKDAFERYYKAHLARRLLNNRSVSDDAERGMLAKLKVECGFQFTKKMEGMFNDMKLSTDIMVTYKDYLSKTTAPSVEIIVTVMTSTFWPSTNSGAGCNFPQELLKACGSFERFYNTRHSGRRLTWQPALGNADVKVAFKAKKHELNVSTFALVILLLFEDLADDDFLTYEDIKTSTAIPDADLQRHLQSLACAKFKILKKHPPSRDVSVTDSFSFNIDFTSPLHKIKISTVASRVESQEERKETQDRIDEERKQQADACIVRVMKDRKVLGHNDLVNEVIRQLSHRFQPNPAMIKRRIEALIEREYLERREDKKSYNYLA